MSGSAPITISKSLKNALVWAWGDRLLGRDESCPIEGLKASTEWIYGLDPAPFAELKRSWRKQAPGLRLLMMCWRFAMGLSEDEIEMRECGIVESRMNHGSVSGKDLCVLIFQPFTGYVNREWRADSEVDLIMVEDYEWNDAIARYHNAEANVETNDRD